MKLKFEYDKHLEDYQVINKKEEFLGVVFYDDDWKCWVWEQDGGIQMSGDCLQQVVDFMKKLNAQDNKEEKK